MLIFAAVTASLRGLRRPVALGAGVAFGATVGTLTGIQVMRYNDAHPDNKLSRWLAHTSVAPNGSRGVSVGMSLPLR